MHEMGEGPLVSHLLLSSRQRTSRLGVKDKIVMPPTYQEDRVA